MVTKFHNVSVDPTLSNNSNILVPSERAVRAFVASKAVQLDFLQAATPTTYTTGQKWLNTQSNILYTATSNSTWDNGLIISIDQFFTFNDLLYYYNGTNVVTYSTHSIIETHNDNKLKFWVGTTAEYDALGTYDSNTFYIKSDDNPSTSAVLATQTEFDNSSSTKAATPYQIKQELGNYLPKSGGNLNASAVLRLTNANNEVSALAFNTSGYLTISTGLNVNNDLTTNSLVVRSGNLYKASTGGTSVVWTDTYASNSSYGAVKVDGTTITANNGVISASGSGGLANTATGTDSLTVLGTPTSGYHSINVGVSSEASSYAVAIGNQAKANEFGGVAVGNETTASGIYAISIGDGNTASEFHSIVLGQACSATASSAIQIGYGGTNNTAKTLSVAFDRGENYQLLDSTGKIPVERMPATIADTSLSNLTDAGKILGAGLGMISDTYTDLTIGADGTQYTAPANGYVNFTCTAGTMLQLYNLTAGSLFTSVQVATSSALGIWLPVKKDDIFSIYYVVTTPWRLRFHYAEGSKSEAN